jgi:jasmonate O-methyltransferase
MQLLIYCYSLQEKAILETRPVLRKAIEEVYMLLSACRSTMIVADLGCSSGPNTLLVVSEVISAIHAYTKKSEDARGVEVQFFLNDLPGNDFNLVFRSLEHYDNLGHGKETPPYYVAGLPGSYYQKLFPGRSVHLFHSSYSLMWRSKVHPSNILRILNVLQLNVIGIIHVLVK